MKAFKADHHAHKHVCFIHTVLLSSEARAQLQTLSPISLPLITHSRVGDIITASPGR